MHQNGVNQRLAPGGAELNLLPSINTSTTTQNGAIYRNQGKLIVKGEIIFYFIFRSKEIYNSCYLFLQKQTILVVYTLFINQRLHWLYRNRKILQ
jgi:hypothetical protein